MNRAPSLALVLPVGKRDHIQGPASALVTLVEYGDYQCPFCGDVYPVIQKLQQHFGEQLRFVFRNFPLTRIHAFALRAAEAAEAAGAQNKFWEMHDYLFEHQAALDAASLVRAAVAVGLDRVAFDRAVAEHRHLARIEQDLQSGIDSGVGGTPTLFLNGRRNDAADDYDTLKATVEQALVLRRATPGKRRVAAPPRGHE